MSYKKKCFSFKSFTYAALAPPKSATERKLHMCPHASFATKATKICPLDQAQATFSMFVRNRVAGTGRAGCWQQLFTFVSLILALNLTHFISNMNIWARPAPGNWRICQRPSNRGHWGTFQHFLNFLPPTLPSDKNMANIHQTR